SCFTAGRTREDPECLTAAPQASPGSPWPRQDLPPGPACQVPRVGDLLPVRGRSEVLHAEIDPDGAPGWRQGFRGGDVDSKVTYQRPSGSRATITIAGSSPATAR